jgi:hypothetical protein
MLGRAELSVFDLVCQIDAVLSAELAAQVAVPEAGLSASRGG